MTIVERLRAAAELHSESRILMLEAADLLEMYGYAVHLAYREALAKHGDTDGD